METIPKPDALLALHGVTEEMFDTLKRWFDVPDVVSQDLADVDAGVEELGDPVMIAATAMRKLQALRLLATPGVRTSTDVVVSIIQDLNRALLQAPVMRLRRAAEHADWDAELAGLLEGDESHDEEAAAPDHVDDDDEEAREFRRRHARLHEAMAAVLQASEGEIRYFI